MKNQKVLLGIGALGFSLTQCTSVPESEHQKPNIVLIMGDDIGYSDLGCYGSEINTPNLDNIGVNGVRFQTFYNAAKSHPTRSSMLTGLYMGNKKTVNIATLLSAADYTTIHVGKEHFDPWIPESCLAKNCFDYSFWFWAINEFHIPSDSIFIHPFNLGKKELSVKEIKVEKQPFFKTDVLTDYAIKFLNKAKKKDKPFFLYLPYNAAHFPLHARPEDIAKYRGKYKIGWDAIRQSRFERMKEIGILDDNCILSEPTDNVNQFRGHPKGDEEIRKHIPKYRPWSELTDKEKDDLDLEMAVFAAMVDRMDQNIGRVIKWLKDNGQFENTIIMYLSDNGSCPYDSNVDFEHPPGPADTYRTLGAAWANVGNTPFKYFKQFGHEGGCNTHFIFHWPKLIQEGFITTQPGHIVDIVPTLLEITSIEYPEEINDLTTIPLHGSSLYPIIKGETREEPEFFISGFTERFKMYRSGDWKIVKLNDKEWSLYNITQDKTEIFNLADSLPDLLSKLSNDYQKIKTEFDILEKADE